MSGQQSDFNLSLDVTATRIPPDAPPAVVASNKLWLRAWGLFVGVEGIPAGLQSIGVANVDAVVRTQGGTTRDLSDFRIVFEVEQVASQMPWKMFATVYNVPPQLAQQIIDQFTGVLLIAGYQLPQPKQPVPTTMPTREEIANLPPVAQLPQGYRPGGSQLFDGQVVWYERGREEGTDTFLRIYANSFDIAHNQATINTTLPAGSTQRDVVQACVDAMAKEDKKIKLGVLTAGMDDMKSPRARTLYGMPRDILRDVAQSVGAQVLIDGDGKVNIVKTTDDLIIPGAHPMAAGPPIIKLNALTGMIGVPRQNMDGGMSVRCLLNPAIQPFTKIQLNNAEITQKSLSNTTPIPGGGGMPDETRAITFQKMTREQAPDGIYKVWSAKHSGDNRGTPWYTDIITFAANPASQAPKVG